MLAAVDEGLPIAYQERAYRMEDTGPLTHVVILGSTGSIGR